MNIFCLVDNLLGTTIAPQMPVLKMLFFFQRWGILVPWSVGLICKRPGFKKPTTSGMFYRIHRGLLLVSIRFQRVGETKYKSPLWEEVVFIGPNFPETHPNTSLLWPYRPSREMRDMFLGRHLEDSRSNLNRQKIHEIVGGVFQTTSPNKTIYQNICWFQ